MALDGFYPVLGSSDVEAASRFYVTWFGFEVTFAADWYVSLRRSDASHYELALLDPTHPTVPDGYRQPASGVLLNLEVDDVDAEWERLVVTGGLVVERPIRTEEFGQRHFIVAAPDGVLVDVITVVPSSPEYAAMYSPGHGSSIVVPSISSESASR